MTYGVYLAAVQSRFFRTARAEFDEHRLQQESEGKLHFTNVLMFITFLLCSGIVNNNREKLLTYDRLQL